MANLKRKVWHFLYIGFFAWGLRMIAIYNAPLDAIAMFILSIIIYNNEQN